MNPKQPETQQEKMARRSRMRVRVVPLAQEGEEDSSLGGPVKTPEENLKDLLEVSQLAYLLAQANHASPANPRSPRTYRRISKIGR